MSEENKAFKMIVRGFQIVDGIRHGYKYRKFMILAPNKYIAEDEIERVLEKQSWERVEILSCEEEIETGYPPAEGK